MNIGIATDTYKPRINGVVRSIQTFTQEFRRQGHRVIILAPEFPDYVEKEMDVWRFPSDYSANDPEDRIYNPFRRGSLKLFRKLTELDLDIMHTQTPFSMGIAMLTWARQQKVPVVHTYHTLFETYVHHYVKAIPEKVGRYLVHQGSRTFCNRHHHIVTPSRSMARVLRHYGVRKPISVIPTGINLAPFKKRNGARMRRLLGFSPKTPLLLSMGRVAGEKNIPFLLDVMEKLRKMLPKAKLVIAGSGPGVKSLKAECFKRGLVDQVLFIGYVTGQDWVDLFAGADLHVLASVTETQGLVLTEAMAAGTPCVAVGAMGVRDVMAQGGGLVVRPNVEAFAQAVVRLLKDKKLYSEMKAEALRVAQRNAADRRAKEMIMLYEKVIAEQKMK